ncbi:Flp pilus assembly protein CpaB [Pendulispora albinea]|uniref:Flp pilus assembly protein CpaB n=1 Tax=Pendulispora albinea TaxID=2741071 RepID=A0ABZ2LMJ4_9BACT
MAIYSSEGTIGKAPPRPGGASRKVRVRAIVFMTIALAAGSASAWMVVRYVARHAGSGTPVAVNNVVVAAVDVPVASKLTPDQLKIVDWPASARPQGSFERVGDVEGRVTSAALVAGEPIVEARLSPKGAAPGMASLIPPNMRAMTVPVNEVVGVGGFIHPGDLVDVITTMQEPLGSWAPAGQPEYRSKIVLQNIRVLAAGQRLATDGNKPETVPAVTLLVSPDEAERLALSSTQGKLQLTMRSQSDSDSADTHGVSPRELLDAPHAAPAPPPPAAPETPVRRRSKPAHPAPVALAQAQASTVDVVEVLHGDRIEKRNVASEPRPLATKGTR